MPDLFSLLFNPIGYLHIRKNIVFYVLHDLFGFQFWHCFEMSFGIGFGSMLEPLWHKIQCLLVIVFLMICRMVNFLCLYGRRSNKCYIRLPLFGFVCDFFRHQSVIVFWSPLWLNLALCWSFWVPSLINLNLCYNPLLPFGTRVCKAFVEKQQHPRRDSYTSQGPRAEHCRRHI